MPNAQEHLDNKYGWWEKMQITNLNLSNLDLEGDLDLDYFTTLQEINITGNPHLGELRNLGEKVVVIDEDNWKDIHEDFAKTDYSTNYPYKTYQQWWEEQNLTYQDAQQWIPVGLEPTDYYFASYLKQNNITHKQYTHYKNQSPQEQLDYFYVNKNKTQVKEINLKDLNFNQSSKLTIDNYPNLKEIYGWDIPNLTQLTITNCSQLERININNLENLQQLILNNLPKLKGLNCSNNKLTTLEINNCANLERINFDDNKLTQIKLPSGEKLEYLDLSNNNLNQDLSFLSGLVNLKQLYLHNNPLYGSLEPLKGMSKLWELYINETDIDSGLEYLPESIWSFNCSVNEREEAKCRNICKLFANNQGEVETEILRNIKNFPQKLQWIKLGFTKEERNSWISAGATLDDHGFVAWLRDAKKLGLEWITNYKEDYQELSNRFKKYGLCRECNQLNTGEQWCQSCNNPRIKKDFAKWTSHNLQVNEFIQKYQLQAIDADKFLEWIPHEQFMDIEYLAEGGFGKVYKAKWTEGNIHHWDNENKQWRREKDNYNNYKMVVLKSLTNSQENTDFLQETANHKIIDDWFNNIVPCYGISHDPNTGNCLMVIQYMPEGNLRHYLSKNNRELKEKLARKKELGQEIEVLKNQAWNREALEKKQQELSELHSEIVSLQNKLNLKDKLSQLLHIAQGLKDLHQKNLVHRDFHSGNILKGIKKTSCLITDLGLCKPANETRKEDKIYGVMPYVAPEVLQSRSYTQATDIYSFGIVAYEIITGLPPYYDRPHNQYLGLAICQGLRPQFNIKIPLLLENLIKKCWDADPKKRPTASELERILRGWKQGDAKFNKQFQEAEEYNKTLPDIIKYPDYQKKMHKGAIYHSQLLPTKEITRLLLQNSSQTISCQLYNAEGSAEMNFSEALNKVENELANTFISIQDWTNIHPDFTKELIKEWENKGFTYETCKEWADIGLKVNEADCCTWLRDTKNLTPEQVLNHSDLNTLKQEYQATQQQAHILHKTN